MPNWNMNLLHVKGKPSVVKQFIIENFTTDKVYEKENSLSYVLDFEVFKPTPVDESGKIINDWYNWRINNWGCKWTPSDQYNSLEIEFKNGDCVNITNELSEEYVKNLNTDDINSLELLSNFYTPWAPPDNIFAAWSEKYKDDGLEASLRFYEPGCGFAGEMVFIKGGDDEYIVFDYDKEGYEGYLKFVLENEMESLEFYMDTCYYYISEMHKKEGTEVIQKIYDAVVSQIESASLDDRVKLILDIEEKYNEFCKK